MRRKAHAKPMRKYGYWGLIIEVLESAQIDYHSKYKTKERRRWHDDAVKWLDADVPDDADDDDRIFTFNWCCDGANLSRSLYKRLIKTNKRLIKSA